MCKLCYITILTMLAVTSGQGKNLELKPKDNLTLTCESVVPIHWCFPATYATPDISETINYTSPTTINYEYSERHKYRITIEVKNVTYIYTGFYHCVKNDSQELCNRQMKSHMEHYVYIEDQDNLMVVKQFKRIWAQKYKQAILPCLPTHPRFTMTLIKNGIMLYPGQQDSSFNITYDPRLGYILEPVKQNEIGYVCNAAFGNRSEKFVIDVDISDVGIELTPPVINATWKQEKNVTVMQGESLNITCHSMQSEQLVFDIKWTYPRSSKVQINREYCHEPGQMCKNYTLAINNITSDDAGDYTCLLMSPPLEPEMSIFELHVLRPENNSDTEYGDSNISRNTTNAYNRNDNKNIMHFFKFSSSQLDNSANIDLSDHQHRSDDFDERALESNSGGNSVFLFQQTIISVFILQFIICSYSRL